MAETELTVIDDDSVTDRYALPVVKAHFIGRDGTEVSNVHGAREKSNRSLFHEAGAIEPPIDPNELAALFEMSGALRTNVDTYATNIDGFGYDLEAIVDLDDEDIYEMVRQALLEEKLREQMEVDGDPAETAKRLMQKVVSIQKRVTAMKAEGEAEGETPEDEAEDAGMNLEISDAEVEEKIDELRRTMVWEEQILKTFFDFCCVEMSFTALRTITRQDQEVLGNGYWEVLRNGAGEPVQFTYIPGYTVRLMPADKEPLEVTMDVPRTLLRVDKEPVNRRFRRFVQVLEGGEDIVVYFKEFGDPRVLSVKSGKYYKDEKALERAEPGTKAATELMHFRVHSARTPYGIPRWISELLAVLGNRHAEEINLAYFENKSIPPMAILVSGGRLAAGETEKLKDFIKNEIRGKRNFHKILVLQAEPFQGNLSGQNSGTVKIEIKPLQQFQQDDGLFMKYQEANADRVGGVFRTPRLLRGDVRDFNRATADASLAFAERQVFSPLRKDFDWKMNRQVMPALGVRFWRFVSKGPETTDLGELGKLLNEAASAGYLSLKELREIAGRVFGRKFAQLDDDDENMLIPLEFLRLGLSDEDDTGLDDGEDLPENPDEDTIEQARKRAIRRRRARSALRLMALEAHFQEMERERSRLDFAETHAAVNG